MDFSQLNREVLGFIGDQSQNILLSVPDVINDAVQNAAEEVTLPTLKRLFTVVTSISASYVNLPSAFSGKLRYIGDVNGPLSLLDGGLEALLSAHPDLTAVGTTEDYVQEGNILYYSPIPTVAVSVICVGYNYPATLVNPTDTPTDIPPMLHRPVICFKAAMDLYSVIEDGMEAEKVNTAMFSNLYEKQGLNKLREWADRRKSHVGHSCWSV